MNESFENDEEDLNSSVKGNELIKGKNKLSFMQKIIIIVIILIILISILIVVVIFNFGNSNKIKKIKTTAEINCIYSISYFGKNISILGNDFNFNSISKIIIDNKINITSPIKQYNFSSIGNHTIKYIITNSLKMDYLKKHYKFL